MALTRVSGNLIASGVSLTFNAGNAAFPALTTTGDTNTGIFFPAADAVATSVAGTEGMRLTSTGLGIGTTTLPQKLNIGGINATNNTNQNSIEFQDGNTNTVFRITGGRGASGNEGYGVFSTLTGGVMTERMRIDSAGNVGIGVTPSAWSATGAGGPVLQIKRGMFFGSDSETRLIHNAYYDGSDFRYIATDPATNYQQSSGQHRFYTAASGTAGDAISFTQAMTLDASGNLGIGTTSPSNKVSIVTASGSDGFISVKSPLTETAGVVIDGGTSSNKGSVLKFSKDATVKWQMGTDSAINGGTTDNFHLYGGGANSILFSTNTAERMRLDSTGNLGIGASSPEANAKLTVYGAGIAVSRTADTVTPSGFDFKCRSANAKIGLHVTNTGQTATLEFGTANDNNLGALINVTNADPLRFGTNNTERARIDSSGRFMVGTTTALGSANFSVDATNSDFQSRFYNSNASPSGTLIYYSGAAPNGTSNWFLKCQDTSAERMYVRSNGGIGNYQGNDANLSDRREKTNFAPAKNYLDIICSIPIQTFNYIDQNHKDDPGLTLGAVAQDVQKVAPEFVMESNWGTEKEPKMRLSIYQTDLQYALMKCIQEQQAIIESLKARLDAANL